jgi:hypothetical protein
MAGAFTVGKNTLMRDLSESLYMVKESPEWISTTFPSKSPVEAFAYYFFSSCLKSFQMPAFLP